ncbi:uracil phosphoribosyltransferase, partial [Campylobacter ureolyticus]|uniref:uracil phosphoribosyltransferase n=1 Tax=Campylobacter ureolyticus TaxID=827 RepID=UPI002907E8D2
MKNIKHITHPLIEHKLTILRDIKTDPFQFRMLIDEITYLLIFEACRDLELKDVKVPTPVSVANC